MKTQCIRSDHPAVAPNSFLPGRWRIACLCTLLVTALLANSTWAQNHPPVADAGGDRSAYVGESITLNGSAMDPDGDAIIGWAWQLAVTPAGAVWMLTPDYVAAPTFSASTAGDYLVFLMVVDSRGGLSAPDYATIHVVTNLPPVAIATANPTNVVVGGTICFDGSQSYDPEGGALSYFWDFADGSSYVYGAVAPCHTYASTGTFAVLFGVTDERGATDTDVVVITVNPPPAPKLWVTRTTTNTVAVSWPSPSTGWILQQSFSLLDWGNVTDAIQDDGTTKTLIISPAIGRCFYRLHKP